MPESVVRKIKIMISSTRSDLAQYRERASEIIKKVAAEKERLVQLTEISMEKETQSGDRESAVGVSKRWVEEADWVVVIAGWNYGTISDEEGADGMSVTEWEYRHASKLNKKRFVFIAGDPENPNPYRYSDEENVDLKDWWHEQKQDKTKLKKMVAFRKELLNAYTAEFDNLRKFCERLEATLKSAIDDLLPVIPPATPLADLILEMTPDIRDCIQKIILIANCKQIHDLLHELRQHAIRPLREEVLSQWKQEGTLSRSREREIWRCMNRASRPMGGIDRVSESLDSEVGSYHRDLCRGVYRVKEYFEKWDNELASSQSEMSVGKFTESVELFAEAVQDAFSEADRSMAKEESELGVRYEKLLQGLRSARRRINLSSSEHQRLDIELEKVMANRKHVKNSLTIHHRWQEIHDKLHELDSFREWGQFHKKLEYFCTSWVTKLLDLVDIEFDRANSHKSSSFGTGAVAVAAPVQQSSPKSSQGNSLACSVFYDYLHRLKEGLEVLGHEKNTVAFDKMRKPFDDAFYCIDKKTLRQAQRANKRAVELREWLDELAKRHRYTD